MSTDISYTSIFGSASTTYKHLLTETAGDSSSQLTLGTDVGKIHVDTHGETSTMTLASDLAEINVTAGDNTYNIKLNGATIDITLTTADETQKITMDGTSIILNEGAAPSQKIYLGDTGMGQQLVTKSFIDLIFATHMHPTAAPGPPSPPIPMPMPGAGTPTSADSITNCTTHTTLGD